MKEKTNTNFNELKEIWINKKLDDNKYNFERFIIKKLNKRKIHLNVIENFIQNVL